MSPEIDLAALTRCFQGIVPSSIATAARDGTPNVTFLSQVYYVDPGHVALSCQFFNKTKRNLLENPHATVELYDPLTFEAYRLRLIYRRSETHGPLFEDMALRIQAIASVTGMAGIFRLIAADVFEVLAIERVPWFTPDPAAVVLPAAPPPLTQLLGGQIVSQQINRARDLDELLGGVLPALEQIFGVEHAMVLVPDESGRRLVTIASHGAARGPVAGEIGFGEGTIGAVAEQRRVLRFSGVAGELRYGRAIRARVAGTAAALPPEIPLAGLPDAESQLALPLEVQDRLVGVLALESRRPLAFDDWDQAFLQILANQIAIGMDKLQERPGDRRDAEDDAPGTSPGTAAPSPTTASTGVREHLFTFYRNDDCVFLDGHYLIRNVPAKILWKLLSAYKNQGRSDFSNRELRLDPSLGLPPVRDNLESRLVLLRRRLEQQCPAVRLSSTGRGRFTLEVAAGFRLEEKASSAAADR